MEMEMEMKMESLLHRDRDRGYSLLGPAPRDPFGDPIGLSKRRSEVDFGDVFGGPPRNTSVYELRRSLGTGKEEVTRSPGRPWASLGERPVFGECFSPSTRRKDLGDDFFGDIFKGNEGSACSTPRMMSERDSTSSSRVLSPARSLPPRSEVFGGGASLLSQLSFSKKITQEQENLISSPDNSSPIQIKKEGSYLDAIRYMPAATKHVGESQSEQRATRDLFHQSSFSSRFSNNKDWSTETVQSTRNNNERQVKENSNGSKVSRNGQFHFSMYKWASKGVMLVVPSNSKERNKHDSKLSGLPLPFLQGVDLPSSNKIMPTSYSSESENQVNGKSNELCAWENSPRNSVKDLSEKNLRRFEAAPDIITLAEETVNNHQVMNGSAKNNSSLLNKSEQVLICMQEKQKSVPLDHDDVINDHYESYENKVTKQEENRDDLLSCATSTRSADGPVQCRKRSTKEHVGDQSIAQDVPLAGGRVKGKVKEFIKIFNQDLSCKPVNIVDPQSWNSKVHDISKPEVKDNVKTSAIKETNRNIYGSKNGEDAPIFIEPILMEDKPQSHMDNNGQRTCGSSNEKEEESTEELSEDLYSTMEEIHYEVEEFMVEDILEEHTELPQKDSDLEVIQQLDAKIRTWSAGKEGNIRSLLSTLQYICIFPLIIKQLISYQLQLQILWEGSGWKPVALVDIIEGNSVKRAYQRAMLCLHPDKLQQRGTPMHLRYIAEKVFDILQESWDHFNTLSAL